MPDSCKILVSKTTWKDVGEGVKGAGAGAYEGTEILVKYQL
jgi:hypothetical protein